jgi:heterodisulfide reductase subunit A-like polyferredoxin
MLVTWRRVVKTLYSRHGFSHQSYIRTNIWNQTIWGLSMKRVLVVGGGAAGMAAALELARRGIPATIVERSVALGGKSNELACKGSPQCVRCDVCYSRDLISEVQKEGSITTLLDAEIKEVEHREQGLRATVRTGDWTVWADAGAMIIATGALPYDASEDPRLHYGECPDVLTSNDVERELTFTGELKVPSTGQAPKEMAIVQCVGSRDTSRGKPYCSKACCKYGFRLGQHLRSLYPQMKLTFFYMDWRPLEDEGDALELWAIADGNVQVIRSRPSDIIPGARPAVRYTSAQESVIEQSFDVVMLTVGMVPRQLNSGLEEMEGIGRDENGFLASYSHRVLLAGACCGPKDVRESVEEGVAVAGLLARRLGDKA